MNKPLASVVIPLYNHEKFVADTINSILAQSFQDFEIIIVDDCSSDKSVEIVESIKDPRIRLFKNNSNFGTSVSANIALKNLSPSSEFVVFFTSDDLMKVDRIKNQISFLQNNPRYGAVFSQIEMIGENGEVLSKKTDRYKNVFIAPEYERHEWLRHFFVKGNCLASPTMTVRRSVIEDLINKYVYCFHPALYQTQDFDFSVRICVSGYEIFVIPEELISLRKRNHEMNLSSDNCATRARLLFENEKIMYHYLDLDQESLQKVFPQISFPICEENEGHKKISAKFLLVMEALKSDKPYLTNFAINVIYDVMSVLENVNFLKKTFNFSIKDFASIVARYPIAVFCEKKRKSSFFKKIKKLIFCIK